MSTNIKQAAQEYLQRGWSVIPILGHDKRPAIRWQQFQQRRSTPDELDKWFRQWPDGNIAIVTGVVSDLVVLDIDPKHGGNESLLQLLREHGPLPHTIEAQTGGGGRHVYFSHPGGMVRNLVGLAPGIDLRGDGGYVVAPPSIHASGKCYCWLEGHDPKHTLLAPLPGWLVEAVGGKAKAGHTLEHWRQLVRKGVVEGDRNNTLASLSGHLLWHGVDADVIMELLLCWNHLRCRPPLPDGEVVRTVESITRMHGRHSEEP